MFKISRIDNGRQNVPEIVLMPTTAGVKYTEGEALVITAGKLAKAGATVAPQYIALEDVDRTILNTPDMKCYRVTPDMYFKVPVDFSEMPKPLVVGTKVTLDADSVGVTDVTASGVATIVETLDAKQTDGEEIIVRFE